MTEQAEVARTALKAALLFDQLPGPLPPLPPIPTKTAATAKATQTTFTHSANNTSSERDQKQNDTALVTKHKPPTASPLVSVSTAAAAAAAAAAAVTTAVSAVSDPQKETHAKASALDHKDHKHHPSTTDEKKATTKKKPTPTATKAHQLPASILPVMKTSQSTSGASVISEAELLSFCFAAAAAAGASESGKPLATEPVQRVHTYRKVCLPTEDDKFLKTLEKAAKGLLWTTKPTTATATAASLDKSAIIGRVSLHKTEDIPLGCQDAAETVVSVEPILLRTQNPKDSVPMGHERLKVCTAATQTLVNDAITKTEKMYPNATVLQLEIENWALVVDLSRFKKLHSVICVLRQPAVATNRKGTAGVRLVYPVNIRCVVLLNDADTVMYHPESVTALPYFASLCISRGATVKWPTKPLCHLWLVNFDSQTVWHCLENLRVLEGIRSIAMTQEANAPGYNAKAIVAAPSVRYPPLCELDLIYDPCSSLWLVTHGLYKALETRRLCRITFCIDRALCTAGGGYQKLFEWLLKPETSPNIRVVETRAVMMVCVEVKVPADASAAAPKTMPDVYSGQLVPVNAVVSAENIATFVSDMLGEHYRLLGYLLRTTSLKTKRAEQLEWTCWFANTQDSEEFSKSVISFAGGSSEQQMNHVLHLTSCLVNKTEKAAKQNGRATLQHYLNFYEAAYCSMPGTKKNTVASLEAARALAEDIENSDTTDAAKALQLQSFVIFLLQSINPATEHLLISNGAHKMSYSDGDVTVKRITFACKANSSNLIVYCGVIKK